MARQIGLKSIEFTAERLIDASVIIPRPLNIRGLFTFKYEH
jgi:hypothetical protein